MRHSLRSLRRHRSATTFLSVVSCSPKISSPTARDRRRMISCNHGGTQVLTVAPFFLVRTTTSPISFMRLDRNVLTSEMRRPVYTEMLMKSLRSLPVIQNLYSCCGSFLQKLPFTDAELRRM